MAKPPLNYLSQVYSDDQYQIYAYQGLLHSSIPVTIKEQLYPSLSAANSAIQESLRLCALRHSAVSRVHACYMDREADGRYKAVTVLEELIGGIEGRQWSEWELIALLRNLVSALSAAERQGFALELISPRVLFITSTGVKLFPSFGFVDPAYFSPERLQSQGQYNPFISDVYSLGLTVLSLALGQNSLEIAQRDPQTVLGGLGTLGQLLGWMLNDLEHRPGFCQMDEYFQTSVVYVEQSADCVAQVAEENKGEETRQVEREEVYIAPSTKPNPAPSTEPNPRVVAEVPVSPKPELRPKAQVSTPADEHKASDPPNPRQCPVCFSSFFPPKKHPNSQYCSQKCKENKALRDPLPPAPVQTASPQCAYCPASLNESEKRDLSCGHSFHSLDCLFTFMKAKTGNFTSKANYNCPKCNKRIKYGKEIEGAFGKSALQKRIDEAKEDLLCSQCHSAPFAYEHKGNLLCKACSGVD